MSIKFTTPIVFTENLTLRKLTIDDAVSIYKIRSDEKNMKYVGFKPYEDIPRAERFINNLSKDINDGLVAFWGIIINNEKDNVIGTICLMPYEDRSDIVEVGYELNSEFIGKGIMTEALEAIINLCFNKLSFNCICADTNINNERSLRLLERFSFVIDEKETENDFRYFYLYK